MLIQQYKEAKAARSLRRAITHLAGGDTVAQALSRDGPVEKLATEVVTTLGRDVLADAGFTGEDAERALKVLMSSPEPAADIVVAWVELAFPLRGVTIDGAKPPPPPRMEPAERWDGGRPCRLFGGGDK